MRLAKLSTAAIEQRRSAASRRRSLGFDRGDRRELLRRRVADVFDDLARRLSPTPRATCVSTRLMPGCPSLSSRGK